MSPGDELVRAASSWRVEDGGWKEDLPHLLLYDDAEASVLSWAAAGGLWSASPGSGRAASVSETAAVGRRLLPSELARLRFRPVADEFPALAALLEEFEAGDVARLYASAFLVLDEAREVLRGLPLEWLRRRGVTPVVVDEIGRV